jgi:hypothetical protein
MTLGSAIFTQAQAASGLTDLLGTGSAMRFYKLNPPQGVAAPYIIWQGIGGRPATVHGAAVSLSFASVQFACFATTPEGASALRKALIAAFDNVLLGNSQRGTLQDDNRDDYEEAVNLYRADADFVFPQRPTD